MTEREGREGGGHATDHVVCLTCGFAGVVPRGSQDCPDCVAGCIEPMNPLELKAFEAGTFKHLRLYFENSCAPIHPKKRVETSGEA